MGCLALALSVFFRLKSHAINNVSENLSPSIFDKTFNVFNPYPEHIKIIHSILFILPILVFLLAFGSFLVAIRIFEYGFIASLCISIVCLDLIVVEVAPEVYKNTKTFISAVHCGTSLGVGDLEVFKFLRWILPRLSNYYLGLSILFIALAVTLSYIWASALLVLAQFIGLTLEVGAVFGWIGWLVSVFVFVITVACLQILVWKTRNHLTNIPSQLHERKKVRPVVSIRAHPHEAIR